MRNILTIVLCLTCVLVVTSCSQSGPPNLVLFVADDMGWNDVGYHGSEILTPNIDRLAASGVVLDHFYAFPVCSPTRTAMMTGRSPITLGIVRPVTATTKGGLPLDEHILPQAFQDAGYQTFMTGKWHLGASHVNLFPHNRGFDHFYGHLGGYLDYYDHIFTGGLDWQRNGASVREEGYTTELMAAEAVRLLRERDASKPVFLYVPFNAPHSPLQAPQAYIDKYAEIDNEGRRTYAAMVDAMDAAIGEVLATLEQEGMIDNTLMMFFSDNGGARGADNQPLRGGKGTVFEGGLRVPAVMWWPGVLEGGDTIEQFVTVHDLLPTLAAAVGIEVGNTKPLYGENMWPAIRDRQNLPRKDIIIGSAGSFALFHGEWKLVRSGGGRRAPAGTYLFRFLEDPSEENDLAAENPELVKELEAAIDAFPKGEPLGGARAPQRRQPPEGGERPPRAQRGQQGPAGERPARGQRGQRERSPDGDSSGGPETREPYAEAAARN